jgi:hypothetical protein
MGKAIRLGAVLCWFGCACGCGDSPNMTLRDTLNARNELVDALLQVSDDESAKKVSATEVKKIQKRWDDGIRKRIEELQKNLDGAERAVTRTRKAKALQAGNDGPLPKLQRDELPNIFADLRDRAESLVIADEAMEAREEEIKATAKRMVEQMGRLTKLLDQLRWKETEDQKARGIQNPTVNAAELWPNLSELLKAPQGMCGPKEFVAETYTWQAPLLIGPLPANLLMLPKR